MFSKANRELIELIAKLMEQGKVKPVIDQVFPFEQSFQAIEYLTLPLTLRQPKAP